MASPMPLSEDDAKETIEVMLHFGEAFAAFKAMKGDDPEKVDDLLQYVRKMRMGSWDSEAKKKRDDNLREALNTLLVEDDPHEILEQLLIFKDSEDDCCFTPLHIAISEDRIAAVKVLVAHGADMEVSSIEGIKPLVHALEYGKDDPARVLIEGGCNVNAGGYGEYPLEMVCQDLDMVKLMVNAGAILYSNPFYEGRAGDNVLYSIVKCKRITIEVLRYLLTEGGGDVNHKHPNSTPLLAAAIGRRFRGDVMDILELFLELHCDVNAVDTSGNTVLHVSTPSNYSNVLPLSREMLTLVDAGLDVNAVTFTEKHSILHSLVLFLLKYKPRRVPRILGSAHNMIHILSASGHNFFLRNKDGETAYDMLIGGVNELEEHQRIVHQDLVNLLKELTVAVPSLVHQCRVAVRNCLLPGSVIDKIPHLHIPEVMKEYLMFDGCVNPRCEKSNLGVFTDYSDTDSELDFE